MSLRRNHCRFVSKFFRQIFSVKFQPARLIRRPASADSRVRDAQRRCRSPDQPLPRSIVRRKFSIFALCFAWICANGVVWNAVQVVAWAKMFHDYSQVMPWTQALKVTLDGSAPCDVCTFTEDARENERQQLPHEAALGTGSEKILFLADTAPVSLPVAPETSWPGVADAAGLMRTEAVPVPPPRVG